MVKIIECDFENSLHCKAVIELMNHYMASKMGGNLPPYDNETAVRMINGLKIHPSKLVLLAANNEEFVGLSNSFINFGTFAAKPFINIHDIVVLEKYRDLGIGRKLMEATIIKAKQLNCGKITLEVREDNTNAQGLYNSLGFEESKPIMHFWTKYIGTK